MKIFYRITVYDHTRLGNPMGSDITTPELDHFNCVDFARALEVFNIMAENRKVSKNDIPSRPKLKHLYDFGHIGMIIERERIK